MLRNNHLRRQALAAIVLFATGLVATVTAHGQAITGESCATCQIAKNDALPYPMSGQSVTYARGAVGVCNEEINVWLTAPCDGWIRNIQILWTDGLAGQNTAQAAIEASLGIYQPGTFPNRSATALQQPGFGDAVLPAPVFNDEFLMIFPYFDEGQTIAMRVPVTSGQKFVVSLELGEDHDPNTTTGPECPDNHGVSVAQDCVEVLGCDPGVCTPSVNGIVGIGIGAADYCTVFAPLAGDFIVRALVECSDGPDPTGACCLPSGCEILTEDECVAAAGIYAGDATTCLSGCTEPVGACCFTDGTCQNLFEDDCLSAGGIWTSGAACASFECPSDEDGACCFDTLCVVESLTNCLGGDGIFLGIGTTCVTADCEDPPDVGACCLPDDSCLDLTEQACTDLSGTWNGAGTDCGTVTCGGASEGACCFSTGGCLTLSQSECDTAGGTYQGNGTACATAGCDEGACCFDGGGCLDLTEEDCTTAGGTFHGLGTDCLSQSCAPPCPSDTNSDDVVDVLDLLKVLGEWGACVGCDGDVNDDDVVDVVDLLQVLGDWGPC